MIRDAVDDYTNRVALGFTIGGAGVSPRLRCTRISTLIRSIRSTKCVYAGAAGFVILVSSHCDQAKARRPSARWQPVKPSLGGGHSRVRRYRKCVIPLGCLAVSD